MTIGSHSLPPYNPPTHTFHSSPRFPSLKFITSEQRSNWVFHEASTEKWDNLLISTQYALWSFLAFVFFVVFWAKAKFPLIATTVSLQIWIMTARKSWVIFNSLRSQTSLTPYLARSVFLSELSLFVHVLWLLERIYYLKNSSPFFFALPVLITPTSPPTLLKELHILLWKNINIDWGFCF